MCGKTQGLPTSGPKMTRLPPPAWPSEMHTEGSPKAPAPQGDHKAAEEQDTEVANLDTPCLPRKRVLRCTRVETAGHWS